MYPHLALKNLISIIKWHEFQLALRKYDMRSNGHANLPTWEFKERPSLPYENDTGYDIRYKMT